MLTVVLQPGDNFVFKFYQFGLFLFWWYAKTADAFSSKGKYQTDNAKTN